MLTPFDLGLRKHNLMGLVLSDAKYKKRHNDKPFPAYLTRPKAYPEVAATATVGECAEKEATHKTKVKDWEVFDCASAKWFLHGTSLPGCTHSLQQHAYHTQGY